MGKGIKAWVISIQDSNCNIIVFAKKARSAINFCYKKKLLGCKFISGLEAERAESFDRYAHVFKEEKYIVFPTGLRRPFYGKIDFYWQ